MSAVILEKVAHTYPAKRRRAEREALRGVSWTVEPGEIFGVLGPNGSGKSTLFQILATVFPPSSGRALVFGVDAAQNPAAVRQRLGIVFQNPSLDAKLTVLENMRHQGHLYGLSGTGLERKILELVDRYGLSEHRREMAGHLSGGLKRRVELAKGLLHDPDLILLDEPSTGLDPAARRALWKHLKDLRAARTVTLMVTTHLMEEAEECGRIALMDRGLVAAQGTPAALKATIGGDVISIESPEPETLRKYIAEKFSIEPALVDGHLRLEKAQGHAFIPKLVEAFPGLIGAISLAKPTLEDVFIQHTGHRLAKEETE